MSKSGTAARRAAIDLLDLVIGDKRLLSDGLTSAWFQKLDAEDRARAQRLATETLRGLERADRILDKFLKKTPALTVQNALRVGTVELSNGGASHGVVNDLVGFVGAHRRHGALKGLVNAVLRKVAADGPDLWPRLRIPRLPAWLREPLVEAWGREAVQAMESAHFAGAPVDITMRGDREAVTPPGEDLPTGSRRLNVPGQITSQPGFAAGDWWVQDAAAAIPASLLAPTRGEAVLDMCAAPGGKTLQMAAMGADVTALDLSETRLERVRENLGRCGLSARLVAGDALEQQGSYDAILLDAPCSATGTIRRHPDLPFAKDGSEFGGLIELQSQMIDHGWSILRSGGRMVFCTCSLLPDEGEVQVQEALARHADMRVDRDAARAMPGIEADWITEEGGLRLRPDYWAETGGMDGFYMALLRKTGMAG